MVLKNSKYLIIILLLLAMQKTASAQAPSNKADARVVKIQKELNAFKISDALMHLTELVRKYPKDAYLNELQILVRLQIMERILFARSETGIEEGGFLKVDSAWENSHLAAWADDKDSVKNNKLDDVAKAGSLDSTKTVNAKSKKSKKKKTESVDVFEELTPTADANVFIDSSILNNDEYKRNLALNETDKTDAENKQDKKEERRVKLAQERQETLIAYSNLSYEAFKNEILYMASKSTLYVEHADTACSRLKLWVIDSAMHNQKQDSAVQVLLQEADESYLAGDMDAALIANNAALEISPRMYEVYIKMGNIYALIHEDSMAVLYYNSAIAINDTNSNAFFAKANYYFKKGLYDDALENTLEAIMRYPEKKYYTLLEQIHARTAKIYESQWVPRDVFPITPNNNVEDIIVDDKNPWYWYQAAKLEVIGYSQPNGILLPNEITKEKYLEVYAWEKMLDSCKDQNKFAFARVMRKIGYLDCYVYLTVYHHYLYPQFKEFTKTHRKKMEAYFLMLLNWDKPKFDKIRPKPLVVKNPAKSKK